MVVFDADHVPSRDFLVRTVGYFAADPKLFLVQTPHSSINDDPIQRNLGLVCPPENEMFYGKIHSGLDRRGGASFCGSAAVLRRLYLDLPDTVAAPVDLPLRNIGNFGSLLVPGTHLVAGRNRVDITLQQPHRIYCGPEASFGVWTELDLTQSGVAIAPGAITADASGFAFALQAQIARQGAISLLADEGTDPALIKSVTDRLLTSLNGQGRIELASFYASGRQRAAAVALIGSDRSAASFRMGAGGAVTAPAPRPMPPPTPPKAAAPHAGASQQSAAYQRAWQSHDLNRPMQAIDLFQSALAGRLSADQRRDAHYGMALAYLRLQMPEEAAKIAARTGFSQSQRLEVERQILDLRGVAAYQSRQYRNAIAFFDALENLTGNLRRDLAILRAYAYLNSRQTALARREFMRLHNELATNETRRGLAATE